MIVYILMFVYSAKVRTIKIGLVTLCSFVFRRLSQLVWEKFVLGDNLMQTMEQIRNIVSGRLDMSIILKRLEFIWNGRPGVGLYAVGEGAFIIRELGKSKKKGEIDNLEEVLLAKENE